jgi:hypothetical protein
VDEQDNLKAVYKQDRIMVELGRLSRIQAGQDRG